MRTMREQRPSRAGRPVFAALALLSAALLGACTGDSTTPPAATTASKAATTVPTAAATQASPAATAATTATAATPTPASPTATAVPKAAVTPAPGAAGGPSTGAQAAATPVTQLPKSGSGGYLGQPAPRNDALTAVLLLTAAVSVAVAHRATSRRGH